MGEEARQSKNSKHASALGKKFAQDLVWIFSTPPLISRKIFRFHIPTQDFRLLNKEEEKVKLFKWLQKANLKMLGPYFEALWSYYLENLAPTKIVAKNLQVRNEKATVGEFDFIYRDNKTDAFHHLEVAVKYYLGVKSLDKSIEEDCSDMAAWIGPNKNDRLDKKFIKLRDYQSKLSLNESARPILKALGVDRVEPEICLLGYLFYPFDKDMPPPKHSHPSHNKGLWLTHSKIIEIAKDRNNHFVDNLYWRVLEKPFWLSQEVVEGECYFDEKEIYQKISEMFEIKRRPVLCSTYSKNDHSQKYVLKQLVFIVPDDWEPIE